jgi:hypothetical protein
MFRAISAIIRGYFYVLSLQYNTKQLLLRLFGEQEMVYTQGTH